MEDKNMNWAQAKWKYPKLKAMGDKDNDGVKNMFDCKPLDRKKQDFQYKGRIYPDTVLTKQRYSKKGFKVKDRPHSIHNFKDVRKVNLEIAKSDLKETTAYLNTIEKINPGTIDYLRKSKTIVEIGEQQNYTTAAAYLPQSEKRDRGRMYLTIPKTEFHGKTGKGWSEEQQAEYQVKDQVKNAIHEIAHLKRDIEMGKKGVPAGKDLKRVDGLIRNITK